MTSTASSESAKNPQQSFIPKLLENTEQAYSPLQICPPQTPVTPSSVSAMTEEFDDTGQASTTPRIDNVLKVFISNSPFVHTLFSGSSSHSFEVLDVKEDAVPK